MEMDTPKRLLEIFDLAKTLGFVHSPLVFNEKNDYGPNGIKYRHTEESVERRIKRRINSIIKKEMNELFEIINDVRNWPELHNYQDVKILEKEELLDGRRKIVFQVTGNKEEEPVEIWTSQRIIDVTNMCARGVRLEPMYPFRHWILDVVLSVEKEGTKMTWIQDFSMDKNSGFTEEAVEEMINKGSKKELQIFKEKKNKILLT